jgi:hypothetical protein
MNGCDGIGDRVEARLWWWEAGVAEMLLSRREYEEKSASKAPFEAHDRQ